MRYVAMTESARARADAARLRCLPTTREAPEAEEKNARGLEARLCVWLRRARKVAHV